MPTVPVTHHVLTPGLTDPDGHNYSWISHYSATAQKVPSDTVDGAKVRTIYWGSAGLYAARVTFFRFAFKITSGSPARLLNFHSTPNDPSAHAPEWWAAYDAQGRATFVSPLAIDWKRGAMYGPGTSSGGYGPVVNGLIFVAESQGTDRQRQYHFPILTDAEMDARMGQWVCIEGEIGWGRSSISTPGYLKAKVFGDLNWRVNVTDVNTHWVGQQMVILWEGGGYWDNGLQTTMVDDNAACQLGRTRVEMLADTPVVFGTGWGTGTRTSGTPFAYPTDGTPPVIPTPPATAITTVTGVTIDSVTISALMPPDLDLTQYEIRHLVGTTFPAEGRTDGTIDQAPTNTTPGATITKTISGLAAGTTISGRVYAKDATTWNTGYGSGFQATTGIPVATVVSSSLVDGGTIEKGGIWTVSANPKADLLELWADGAKLGETTLASLSVPINLTPGSHTLGIVTTVAGVRTSLGTGGVYATITVTASQQSLPLTVLNQNSQNITLGWTPPANCVGYRFLKNGILISSTWDGALRSQKFTKPGLFKVEALLSGPWGSYQT